MQFWENCSYNNSIAVSIAVHSPPKLHSYPCNYRKPIQITIVYTSNRKQGFEQFFSNFCMGPLDNMVKVCKWIFYAEGLKSLCHCIVAREK